MVVHRRAGDAEFPVDRTVRFHLEAVHREDPGGPRRQGSEDPLDKDFGLERMQTVVLVRTAGRVEVISERQSGNPPPLPPREIYREVPCDASQEGTGIAQVIQLGAGSCSDKHLLRQVTGIFGTDLPFKIGDHTGAFVAVKRLEQ